MAEKGHCREETQNKLKEYVETLIELKNLEHAIRSDHHLLVQILLEHAKRIDNQEQRLILLEDRVYKGGSETCNSNGSKQFARRAQSG